MQAVGAAAAAVDEAPAILLAAASLSPAAAASDEVYLESTTVVVAVATAVLLLAVLTYTSFQCGRRRQRRAARAAASQAVSSGPPRGLPSQPSSISRLKSVLDTSFTSLRSAHKPPSDTLAAPRAPSPSRRLDLLLLAHDESHGLPAEMPEWLRGQVSLALAAAAAGPAESKWRACGCIVLRCAAPPHACSLRREGRGLCPSGFGFFDLVLFFHSILLRAPPVHRPS